MTSFHQHVVSSAAARRSATARKCKGLQSLPWHVFLDTDMFWSSQQRQRLTNTKI